MHARELSFQKSKGGQQWNVYVCENKEIEQCPPPYKLRTRLVVVFGSFTAHDYSRKKEFYTALQMYYVRLKQLRQRDFAQASERANEPLSRGFYSSNERERDDDDGGNGRTRKQPLFSQ